MAIFHLSVKAVSRSAGRSATAAAAYRAGEKIVDERTGEIHDYHRKGGVESADIVLPDGAPKWATDRAKLWNAAELAEKRKDACVAREFEVALPSELSPAERRRLALDFAKDMANREGCAVDVAIHAPGKEGDNRNHHAHILRTTRKVEADGLGAKLDTEKAGRKRSDDLAAVRAKWADLTNERLRENGIAARVDHRSLEAQGIDREPTKHLGPAASGYERRTGQPSDKRIQQEREAVERLARAKEAGELERKSRQLDSLILDLSGDFSAAKAERDRLQASEVKRGIAYARAQFEKQKLDQERETERKPARPKVSQQEADALELQAAIGKKAQWDAALVSERALYLAELTKQAYAQCVAHVAQHQAHVDAKPMLFGRGQWERRRQGLENRDHDNKREWEQLKDGDYPFLSKDKEAVQKAVERRVSDKNPELALSLPGVYEALQAGRERAAVVEARARAEKAKYREVDAALAAFKAHALKREMKTAGYGDYRDTGARWKAITHGMQNAIDGYNSLPKEARPVVLERMRENIGRAPEKAQKWAQQFGGHDAAPQIYHGR